MTWGKVEYINYSTKLYSLSALSWRPLLISINSVQIYSTVTSVQYNDGTK